MRCNHCGSSWQTISSTPVLFCPFCNEALVSLPTNLSDFEEVLSYLVSNYGKDILSNQRVVSEFLEKCLPNAKKESTFLRYAYASGIIEKICKMDTANTLVVDSIRKRAFFILTSDYGVSEEWAKYIIFSILKSIGLSEQGDDTSIVYIQRQAERNDPRAQYELAQMFLDGRDVPISTEKYIYWLNRASQTGSPKASFELARCYIDGKICKQDLSAATAIIKSLIGHVPKVAIYAVNNLNVLSLEPSDVSQALKTIEECCDEIGLSAYMALARFHAQVTKDNRQALFYAQKAYEVSPAEAWELYCQQLKIRNAVGDIPLSLKVMKDAVNDGSTIEAVAALLRSIQSKC